MMGVETKQPHNSFGIYICKLCYTDRKDVPLGVHFECPTMAEVHGHGVADVKISIPDIRTLKYENRLQYI